MLVSKQLHMFGVMGEYGNLEAVCKIMADNGLNLSPVITAKVPFSKCLFNISGLQENLPMQIPKMYLKYRQVNFKKWICTNDTNYTIL